MHEETKGCNFSCTCRNIFIFQFCILEKVTNEKKTTFEEILRGGQTWPKSYQVLYAYLTIGYLKVGPGLDFCGVSVLADFVKRVGRELPEELVPARLPDMVLFGGLCLFAGCDLSSLAFWDNLLR